MDPSPQTAPFQGRCLCLFCLVQLFKTHPALRKKCRTAGILYREGSRAPTLDRGLRLSHSLPMAQSLALFPAQKGRRRARRPQEVASGQGSVSEGPRLPPLTHHLPARQSLLSGGIPRAIFMPKGPRFPKRYIEKGKGCLAQMGLGNPNLKDIFLRTSQSL